MKVDIYSHSMYSMYWQGRNKYDDWIYLELAVLHVADQTNDSFLLRDAVQVWYRQENVGDARLVLRQQLTGE